MINTQQNSLKEVTTNSTQIDDQVFLNSVLEISGEAMFLLDKSDFTIVDCNSAALKLFEATKKKQLIQIPYFRLYNYEPMESSISQQSLALEEEGEYTQEMSFRTCKQNVFWGKLNQKTIKLLNANYTLLKINKSANYLKEEEWLSTIFKETSKSTGRQFLKDLTKLLCNSFNADYAFIARRVANDSNVLKLFYVHGKKEIKTKHLKIKGGLVENVMRGCTTFYPQDIRELFPGDEIVRETNSCSFMSSPMFDSSGAPFGLIAVMNREPLEEIPNSRYMLNILASRTSSEIQRLRSKELLRQQTKELGEINLMKDKLLSVITDDLHGPLKTLLGYSGMLNNRLEQYSPEELDKRLKVMDNSLRNLYVLLDNLSDLSRLQQGVIQSKPKENNLSNLLEDVTPYITYLAKLRDVYLKNNVDNSISVWTDTYLTRAALRNIISYMLVSTMKKGSIMYGADLVDGKWQLTLHSNNHSADIDQIKFLVNESKQAFFSLASKQSIPAVGLFLAREFVKLQGGELVFDASDEVLEFKLIF